MTIGLINLDTGEPVAADDVAPENKPAADLMALINARNEAGVDVQFQLAALCDGTAAIVCGMRMPRPLEQDVLFQLGQRITASLSSAHRIELLRTTTAGSA